MLDNAPMEPAGWILEPIASAAMVLAAGTWILTGMPIRPAAWIRRSFCRPSSHFRDTRWCAQCHSLRDM